jgi:hypothetical protein
VCMNPRIIGADGHDRQIHRLRGPNLAKKVRICCVAAKNYPVPPGVDEIPDVSPMNIGARTGAPVFYFEGTNIRWSNLV